MAKVNGFKGSIAKDSWFWCSMVKTKLPACSFGWWLVLICSERKVLLDGCWWLICSERKILLADG
jgi:hypothetical protein